MSQICPECGNDIYATSAEHRCPDFAMSYMRPKSSRPVVVIDSAELATLRQKLAEAEAELKKCGEAVMTYVETVKRKNREIWAAEADCAAMRDLFLKHLGELDACGEPTSLIRNEFAALTGRPTGQAILDRLKLAEDVADSCGVHVDCVDQYYSREALAAYRAARKANTGDKQ